MPETADNVAHELGITREDSDAFALASQQKIRQAAEADGFYKGEIMAVELPPGEARRRPWSWARTSTRARRPTLRAWRS